jgi:hypothetical protein
MQRALSFETTPAASVPLRFMLAAPWFAAAAGLLLAWTGEAALQSRWSPSILALTHLMTLGFLGMTMLGSMLQMLPVVAEAPVPHVRKVAWLTWAGLGCGTPLLVAGLLGAPPMLFAAAALCLGLALPAFAAAVLVALLRRASEGALPMVAGMRLALSGLAATVILGLSLAAYFAGEAVLPAPLLTGLHAAFGLIGWVAMLVVAVSFQVIPMFQATPVYPRWLRRSLPIGIALLLCGWGAAQWLHWPCQRWVGAGLALLLAVYSSYSLYLLSKTRRKEPDITTRYWLISLGSLAVCSTLYLAPGIDEGKRALLLGILFVAGFATSAVNGMLYKIVPFLLWYHLSAAGVRREAVPKVNAWIALRAARAQYWIHAAALAALCLAVKAPGMARAAGLLFAADAASIGVLLAGAALRYRRIVKASAFERA